MGRGALVLYLNTKENAEVAAGVGIPFEDDLTAKMEMVLAMSKPEREGYRAKAVQRVRERYSWEAVTDAYESLLESL
jgi:glycosyltransferase involved in cell wall biosynthesis